jgi:hypothetical protein
MSDKSQRRVCDEILAIMATYHEQEKRPGGVSTPGGLEHMGDVWCLFLEWEESLLEKEEPCQHCGSTFHLSHDCAHGGPQ